MSTYVLVHGGWAGSWVWERVTPILESHGHRVAALDMPGRGEDSTPVGEITLDTYVQRVVTALTELPKPAVLVGHSSGGVAITQAAEHVPDRIRQLVYVCAYLPGDGQSLIELGQRDPDQLILPNLAIDEADGSARLQPDVVRDALFADCAQDDLDAYLARAVPVPLAAAATPVKVTPDRFGRVPRAYIECLHDRGITPTLQRRMHTAAGCDPVIAMDTGHMPMYAAPAELARHLHAIGDGADRTLDLTARTRSRGQSRLDRTPAATLPNPVGCSLPGWTGSAQPNRTSCAAHR